MSLSGTKKSDSGAQGPLIRLRRRGLPVDWCWCYFGVFLCATGPLSSLVSAVLVRDSDCCMSVSFCHFFFWEGGNERRISAFIEFRGLVPISYPITAQVLLVFTEDVGSLFNRSRLSGALQEWKTTGHERRRNATSELQTGGQNGKWLPLKKKHKYVIINQPHHVHMLRLTQDSSMCMLFLSYTWPGPLSHSTPQITSPAFRLRLRQHSLIYINQSVKTCTAGICLWWKVIESCAGVLQCAEPIPEMFWHSWYLQKTNLRRGYNQAPLYESRDRIGDSRRCCKEWTVSQVLPPTRGETGIVTISSKPLKWEGVVRTRTLHNL